MQNIRHSHVPRRNDFVTGKRICISAVFFLSKLELQKLPIHLYDLHRTLLVDWHFLPNAGNSGKMGMAGVGFCSVGLVLKRNR
jgi:hypothetical protein